MTRSWYRIAVVAPDRAVSIVTAAGEHAGVAIAAAVGRTKNSWAAGFAAAAENEIPLGESIGKGLVVEAGPAWLPAPSMRWPVGVMAALPREAPSVGSPWLSATPGWINRRVPGATADSGTLAIEAQVAGDQVIETFLDLVERMPVIDNVEIAVMGHYDEAGAAPTEVWLSPRLDAKRALRFLDDHDREFLTNGHVEVACYLRNERSTLRLTEHKTIVWVAEDRSTEARIAEAFAKQHVPQVQTQVTVAGGPHVHYRDVHASSRSKIVDRLKQLHLRKVATRNASGEKTLGTPSQR